MIVAAEERVHFVELHRLQIRDLADRRPVVRVIRRIERRQQRHRREPIRAVLVILPALVQHDVALVRKLRAGERREQVPHPIGFHPQRELERAGRHHLPVVGPIGVRRSVERGARALQRLEVPAVVVLRSLEHQVLEEMREPGLAGPLVLRADVIPEVHGDDGAVVVLVNQHVQSVGQRALAEGNVHRKLPQVGIALP